MNKYIDERLIFFLNEEHKEEAIWRLINGVVEQRKLPEDQETFYQAILEREKLVSTGIGIGIAVPHTRVDGAFFVAIGIQKQRGIEWGAIDNMPVHIIFLIGGPEQKQTEYLSLLSWITQSMKDSHKRKKLLQSSSPQEVVSILCTRELVLV